MRLARNARFNRYEEWFSDLPWIAVSVFAISLLVSLALWQVPKRMVKNDPSTNATNRLDRENSIRRTLAQALAGIVVLSGVVVSIRTLRLSREGHLNDRYFNAIEKLGSRYGVDFLPDKELRLGAIYGLERLALDSPRDQWFIMEILTAYVRLNAPPESERHEPREDVQAALTAISRRKINGKRERPRLNVYLSLMPSRLCGANFTGAKLRGVDLERVDLQAASLREAQMQSAALMEANLAGADLQGADLRGAFFRNTILEHADIQNARFEKAIDLTLDQIRSAKNWELAHYSSDFRSSLGLPPKS